MENGTCLGCGKAMKNGMCDVCKAQNVQACPDCKMCADCCNKQKDEMAKK